MATTDAKKPTSKPIEHVVIIDSFYSTTAIATSNDFGHSWPSYRYMLDPNGLPVNPVPSQNPSKGPELLQGRAAVRSASATIAPRRRGRRTTTMDATPCCIRK